MLRCPVVLVSGYFISKQDEEPAAKASPSGGTSSLAAEIGAPSSQGVRPSVCTEVSSFI